MGVRMVPTNRARVVLERLVELNRISGDVATKSHAEVDEEADGDAGLALTPVRRRRLYEDVVQQLQGLISSGRLEPGDQLPAERALAEQLAVSRASVREGLRTLEARGMLEARPGQGLFVRGRRTEEIVSILASYLVRERESFLEVLDVREALERKAAERAAILATTKDLEAIKAALVEMQEEVLEGRLPLESDTAFHRALGTASRNEVLSQTLNTVLGLMSQRRQELLNSDYGGLLMLHQHVNIFRAVKNRDPKAASELISAHLRELAAPHRPRSGYPRPS
ncbi:MAG TPA: FadR/GntR family transcriptional regulator [Thermoleophilia bacterium]|nr:FadR/GntR family transcriptional regulator [Thermoleophilia bacterium]